MTWLVKLRIGELVIICIDTFAQYITCCLLQVAIFFATYNQKDYISNLKHWWITITKLSKFKHVIYSWTQNFNWFISLCASQTHHGRFKICNHDIPNSSYSNFLRWRKFTICQLYIYAYGTPAILYSGRSNHCCVTHGMKDLQPHSEISLSQYLFMPWSSWIMIPTQEAKIKT
jgi:hypothetical protein